MQTVGRGRHWTTVMTQLSPAVASGNEAPVLLAFGYRYTHPSPGPTPCWGCSNSLISISSRAVRRQGFHDQGATFCHGLISVPTEKVLPAMFSDKGSNSMGPPIILT